MNIELHLIKNREKQANYARYLSNLSSDRRMSLLEKMKPALREKMEALMLDQKAKDIAGLLPEVKRMYLTQLKRYNPIRYDVLLPKVAAYEESLMNS